MRWINSQFKCCAGLFQSEPNPGGGELLCLCPWLYIELLLIPEWSLAGRVQRCWWQLTRRKIIRFLACWCFIGRQQVFVCREFAVHSVKSEKLLPVRRTVNICKHTICVWYFSFSRAPLCLRKLPSDSKGFWAQTWIPCDHSSISRINQLKSWWLPCFYWNYVLLPSSA